MKSFGMIEVFSFTTALCTADVCAKTADVKVIAFDRNRPIKEDVPAPLVMGVKIEGSTSAVQAAVEAGVKYAQSKGKYIVSHIIANPDDMTENMAYLMDINKDKFNKNLPKSTKNMPDTDKNYCDSIGILEVQGLVASIEGLDSMLKTADVRLIHSEKRLGGRLVTLVVAGKVDAVQASVENGYVRAAQLGKVYGHEVIARPHEELCKYFDFDNN